MNPLSLTGQTFINSLAPLSQAVEGGMLSPFDGYHVEQSVLLIYAAQLIGVPAGDLVPTIGQVGFAPMGGIL
jgi:hypothetical protein